MTRVAQRMPAAVLAAAMVAMLAGCGETPSNNTTTNADGTRHQNTTTASNSSQHAADRDAANAPMRSTSDGQRAADQARAATANDEATKAGIRPSTPGVAKPIDVPGAADPSLPATNGATTTRGSDTSTMKKDVTAVSDAAAAGASHTASRVTSDATRGTDAATSEPRKVDNSGQNEVDKDGTAMTPMDQGNSDADIGVTQAIRKALVDDNTLSVNAKNLKVITKDGVVVLRGPVASKAEADAVLTHVSHVNGITRLENQIAVP